MRLDQWVVALGDVSNLVAMFCGSNQIYIMQVVEQIQTSLVHEVADKICVNGNSSQATNVFKEIKDYPNVQ